MNSCIIGVGGMMCLTVKKPNTIEKDINEIRLAIYEKTKNMTPQQLTEYYRKSGEKSAKKYGFKLVEKANRINPM